MRRFQLGLTLCLSLAACVGDPTGPRGAPAVERVGGASDTLLIGAPGRALAEPVAFRVRDGEGRPVPGARVRWAILAGNGRLEQVAEGTGSDGIVRAVWVLGTRAGVGQQLQVDAYLGSHAASAEVEAVAIPTEVASLAILAETTEVRVAVPGNVNAEATDPFGNRFSPSGVRFSSLDTTLALVDSAGEVRARGDRKSVV